MKFITIQTKQNYEITLPLCRLTLSKIPSGAGIRFWAGIIGEPDSHWEITQELYETYKEGLYTVILTGKELSNQELVKLMERRAKL